MLSEPVIPSSHSAAKWPGSGNWQGKPSRHGHGESCQAIEIGIRGAGWSYSIPGKRGRESRSPKTRILWRTDWPEIFDCHRSSKNLSEMGGKSSAREARQATESEFCEAEIGWMSGPIAAHCVCAIKQSLAQRAKWLVNWLVVLPIVYYSSLSLWFRY